MKKFVVSSLLLLLCSISIAQSQYKTYLWSEAKSLGSDTIYSISFEKEKIDSIPLELMNFKNLKKLDLSKQKLTKLPSTFTQLSQLEILDLGKNRLTLFPPEICKLTNLRKLVLNRNYFSNIPANISNLTRLEVLDIWATPVETFPEELALLKNLKLIDARGVLHGPKFQKTWKEKLSWVKIEFDAPCNCFE